MIPQDENPEVNFIGLLIGPRYVVVIQNEAGIYLWFLLLVV